MNPFAGGLNKDYSFPWLSLQREEGPGDTERCHRRLQRDHMEDLIGNGPL